MAVVTVRLTHQRGVLFLQKNHVVRSGRNITSCRKRASVYEAFEPSAGGVVLRTRAWTQLSTLREQCAISTMQHSSSEEQAQDVSQLTSRANELNARGSAWSGGVGPGRGAGRRSVWAAWAG